MGDTIYVVTNPNLGYHCVVASFEDEDEAKDEYNTDVYTIHQTELIKKGESKECNDEEENFDVFDIKEHKDFSLREENIFLVMDALKVTYGKFNNINSLNSMKFIASEFVKFRAIKKLNYGHVTIIKDSNYYFVVCDGYPYSSEEVVENGYTTDDIDNMFEEYLEKQGIKTV